MFVILIDTDACEYEKDCIYMGGLMVMRMGRVCGQTAPTLLRWGEHEPTYYYYWPGYGPYIDQMDESILRWTCYDIVSQSYGYQAPIEIYGHYYDGRLPVIGVAAMINYYPIPPLWAGRYLDTVISHAPRESFVLYESDSAGLHFIDSACWNCNPIVRYTIDPQDGEGPVEIHEAYFDTPHIVQDTFFVGNTNNAEKQILHTNQNGVTDWVWKTPFADLFGLRYNLRCGDCPLPYNRGVALAYYKNTYVYPPGDRNPFRYEDTSTWHLPEFVHLDTCELYRTWPCIWPIFDTTGIDLDSLNHLADTAWWHTTCPAAKDLHINHIGHGSVQLGWEQCSTEQSAWRFQCVPVSQEYMIDELPYVHTTETSRYVNDIDTLVWYHARVQSVCHKGSMRDTVGPEWTDLYFQIVGGRAYISGHLPDTTSGGGTQGASSAVDEMTQVSPNPTDGKVWVFSSFQIKDMALYAEDGRLLDYMTVGGASTELDLSGYPKGVYILSINTYRGKTVKRVLLQ